MAVESNAARFICSREALQNIAVHYAFRCILQSLGLRRCDNSSSVAGFGVCGPSGPRGGISSGIWPGNSSGRGDSPGSRTGGEISGCGLPGGISGGGVVGFPGVAGGISGGSIGIGIIDIGCWENDNNHTAPMFLLA